MGNVDIHCQAQLSTTHGISTEDSVGILKTERPSRDQVRTCPHTGGLETFGWVLAFFEEETYHIYPGGIGLVIGWSQVDALLFGRTRVRAVS